MVARSQYAPELDPVSSRVKDGSEARAVSWCPPCTVNRRGKPARRAPGGIVF